MLLDQPLPAPAPSAPWPIARALRAEVIQGVAHDVSVGTAVTACMGLLVAAAVATGGNGNRDRYNGFL